MTSIKVDRRVRRWAEQRWLTDATLRASGVELASKATAGGVDSIGDFQSVARRIKKFDDMHRELAAQARKREARAAAFEQQDRPVSARESYIIASLLWSAAQWPLFEINDDYTAYEEAMNRTYGRFVRLMDRPIERIEIPFGGKSLPGYLHLPHVPAVGERFPLVIAIGGLDTNKETQVAIYGDRCLARGMAVFAYDGPGQGEAIARGLFVTPDNHGDAAAAAVDTIARHPAVDPERIAIRGNSFGSYFGTVASARLGSRIKAFAAAGICQEPMAYTLLHHAPASYKQRLMFMSGHEEETEFDRMATGFDLRPIAPNIVAPYMIVAGAEDALSPIAATRELFGLIRAPKRLVVYDGAGHGIRDSSAAQNGEEKTVVVADWLRDRLDGKPFASESVWIDGAGRATATPYAE
ncbi:MAG TPA: alpha/beta hydrolase [Alphaproteobacteria bacterium]|jgi:pimeloyl-ACP methyl ester carboxylesterase|nr:alpha/beta hydrolase [Alphaproteobacteria bacterium]